MSRIFSNLKKSLAAMMAIVIIVTMVPVTALGSAAAPAASKTTLENYIIYSLTNFEPVIDVTYYALTAKKSPDEIMAVFNSVPLTHPDLFWVDLATQPLATLAVSGDKVFIAGIKYLWAKSENAAKVKKYNAAIAAAIAGISSDMTTVEKLLYLHDYVVLNSQVIDSHSVNYSKYYSSYDVLVDGKGICQGYALAYQELLVKIGFKVGTDTLLVKLPSGRHMWNMVKVNSKWYHIDTTWDDASLNRKTADGTIELQDQLGLVKHSYFLQSDGVYAGTTTPHVDYLDAKGVASGTKSTSILKNASTYAKAKTTSTKPWFAPVYGTVTPSATSATYAKESAAFWLNVTSPIVRVGGRWYYAILDKTESAKNLAAVKAAGTTKTTTVIQIAKIKYYQFANTATGAKAATGTVFTIKDGATWFASGTEVSGKSPSVPTAIYIGLQEYKGNLYFNTSKSLYKIAFSNGKPGKISKVVSTISGVDITKSIYAYGIKVVGTKVQITRKSAASAKDSLKSYALS